jgi:hypothetical protein
MNLNVVVVQLVQLTRALAVPIVVLVALCWFSHEIKEVLAALAYFIKERKFKGTFPGGSVEVLGSSAEAELQNTSIQLRRPPLSPPKFKN